MSTKWLSSKWQINFSVHWYRQMSGVMPVADNLYTVRYFELPVTLGKAALEEGQLVEVTAFSEESSWPCEDGFGWDLSKSCVLTVSEAACSCEKSFVLSSINDHSEAGFLWRFSMQYMWVKLSLKPVIKGLW